MGKHNYIEYKEKLTEMANHLLDEVMSKHNLIFEPPRNHYVKEKLEAITEALNQVTRFANSVSVAKSNKKALEIYKNQYDEILTVINKLSADNKINKKIFLGSTLTERYWYVIDRGNFINSIEEKGYLKKLYLIDKTYIESTSSIESKKLETVEILESTSERLNLYAENVNLSNLFL
jgi:N-acetylglucosamine kinase-like BadF-type ATPase